MLNVVDWFVIFLIICFLILIVKRFASKIKDAESYYMASRSIPFSLLIGTLVASWYGGPALLNTVETAAVSGLAAWGIWCVGAHVARIPLALWIAPAVSMRTEMTIPQMLKKVYGGKVSFFMAIYMLITLLSISEIVAMKNIVAGLWGEHVQWAVPLILTGVVLLTIFGGMMGVAVTDMLLFFCMCTSIAIASSVLWHNIGGWEGLTAAMNFTYGADTTRNMLNPFRGANTLQVVTLLLVSLKVYVHPNLYQRFSAADSPRSAARSYLACFCIFVTMDFLLTITGLVVGAQCPGTNIAQSFIIMVCSALPSGFRGLFAAGLLGAIISTLDSVWLVCGMMAANDIIGAVVPLTDKQKILCGKAAIAVFAVLGYLGAFYFTRSVDVTRFFGTMTMSVQFVMAIMGLFYKGRKTAVGAWAAIISGGITFLLIKFWHPVVTPMGNVDGVFFALPVSLMAFFIGSRFGKELTGNPVNTASGGDK